MCFGATCCYYHSSSTRGTPYGSFGFFFFQAEDGIRDLVRSRGLGDVYKRQRKVNVRIICATNRDPMDYVRRGLFREDLFYRLYAVSYTHLTLPTSDLV